MYTIMHIIYVHMFTVALVLSHWGSRKISKRGDRRSQVLAWVFVFFTVLSNSKSLVAQDPELARVSAVPEIDAHDQLLQLGSLFDVIQFQEDRVRSLGAWPFESVRENKRMLAVDCAGYWEHLTREARKENKRSAREGYSEFFGFLHGRTGASPPKEWRYYLLNGELGDVENRPYSRTMKTEATVQVLTATGRIRFNGGSMTNRGYLEFYRGDTIAPTWQCDLLLMSPVSGETRLSGQTNGTIWAEFSMVSIDGPFVCWGVDNSGYCYAYVIDQVTGRVKDFLFLSADTQVKRN